MIVTTVTLFAQAYKTAYPYTNSMPQCPPTLEESRHTPPS
eukprot:CCRYP_005190-RC/>CCRYP_005190-RC protein AED:0.42 eAED:0.42 QI:161/1/1/1/0/0/2/0/39